MDLAGLLSDMRGCGCGREHRVDIAAIEVGPGLVARTGEILRQNGFPDRVLAVADRNTYAAAPGVLDSLAAAGFDVYLELYDDITEADMVEVDRIGALLSGYGALVSIGSGSNNDICRMAAANAGKPFCIFATAPSMDGFASDSSPLTLGGFKKSYPAKQPEVIIADTDILGAAPARLKSSGFGDMVAKYIGLVDWHISRLVTGEYYCDRIAGLTKDAADRIVALAGKITADDGPTAGAVMEALVMTGVGMKLAGSSRPASGAEHVVSHFWEIKKLDEGKKSDLHGRKVGVATLLLARIYHALADRFEVIEVMEDAPDWAEIEAAYGERLAGDMMQANDPTVTAGIDPLVLRDSWPQIRGYIREFIPRPERLEALMVAAGAPTTPAEVGVDAELCRAGVRYHSYMRHRVTLMRLLPMIRGAREVMEEIIR